MFEYQRVHPQSSPQNHHLHLTESPSLPFHSLGSLLGLRACPVMTDDLLTHQDVYCGCGAHQCWGIMSHAQSSKFPKINFLHISPMVKSNMEPVLPRQDYATFMAHSYSSLDDCCPIVDGTLPEIYDSIPNSWYIPTKNINSHNLLTGIYGTLP